MKTLNVLGIDIGASHGRGYCGAFDGDTLTLREVHRFPNQPVAVHASIYWDVLSLFTEVTNCVLKTRQASIPVSGMGIDTWSQDFGLLDRQGNLLGNPHTYRDGRSISSRRSAARSVSERFSLRLACMPIPLAPCSN